MHENSLKYIKYSCVIFMQSDEKSVCAICIPDLISASLEEAKQFFSEMSIDEFRDYIYAIHYNSVNNIRSVQERFEENKLVPTVAVSVDGGWRYSLILGQGAVLSALAVNIDWEIIFEGSI